MTDEKIIDGITKSLENAGALYEEAKLLQEHFKIERSYLLFQICIEETGKANALLHLLLTEDFKDEIKLKKFLKDFRDHKFKIHQAINIDTITARLIDNKEQRIEFLNFIAKQYENISKINDLKNFSLYVNYFENRFILPGLIIDKKLLENIQFLAETRLLASKQLLPEITKTIDTFRPMYQAEKNSLTDEKLEEWADNLLNGDKD